MNPTRLFSLQHVDDDDGNEENKHGSGNGEQNVPAGQRQTEQRRGNEKENEDEIEDSEPLVIGRRVAEKTSEIEGNATKMRYGIPDENTGDIEKEMTQGQLERVGEIARSGERGEQARHGRADICAERERIRALDRHDAHADERRQRRRENRRRLDEYRHAGADENGDVAGEKTERFGKIRIDRFLDDVGETTAKQRVKQLHYSVETNAQNHESDEEKYDADGGVAQRRILENVTALSLDFALGQNEPRSIDDRSFDGVRLVDHSIRKRFVIGDSRCVRFEMTAR